MTSEDRSAHGSTLEQPFNTLSYEEGRREAEALIEDYKRALLDAPEVTEALRQAFFNPETSEGIDLKNRAVTFSRRGFIWDLTYKDVQGTTSLYLTKWHSVEGPHTFEVSERVMLEINHYNMLGGGDIEYSGPLNPGTSPKYGNSNLAVNAARQLLSDFQGSPTTNS